MVTAIVSVMTASVPRDVANDGEINLRWSHPASAGLKEKPFGRLRCGIKKVLIPGKMRNAKDLADIPATVEERASKSFPSAVWAKCCAMRW